MGGGNAQKTAVARERNLAKQKAASGGVSQLKDKEKAMNIKCKICMQPFMCTQSDGDFQKHIDSKHAGKGFWECFDPTFVAVPNQATVFKGRRLAHEALGTDHKKGYPKDQNIEEFDTKEDAMQHIIDSVDYINDAEAITYQED
mmetsp:Transcript_28239/g.44055  ORF Transcript_28239/g.44055 Transcript_28239/m.44055 type:complete len:144 (-) Transcript_28239:97-528(-)|eukprot:CAMPEP_0184303374 /NCGR_PEP_ID=MMETSP1049-20130417/13131_1 /TAXON_ID=77928 /ORGANISM="Proteomonas sulcata, Strain CCMP704" /LENGTH=143 /DNA_ID=CAMNT_0026614895 /DNA_START=43 /DNA_END=474 /DNA_ORIENTATION=+